MIGLITPLLMSFVTSKKVKLLIIKLLEALAPKALIVSAIVDSAIEDYVKEIEVLKKPAAIIKEVGTFGTDGWSISKTASFLKK